MSYEIYLVDARPGEEADQALNRILDEEPPSVERLAAEDIVRAELASELPVDVDVTGGSVLMTIPYTGSADSAELLLREVFAALTAAQKRTGWTPFDPQLGRTIDLATDLPIVREIYRDTIAVRDEFG